MGCATSICSCTQTVAVTPRAGSTHHVSRARRSAHSQHSKLSPSVASVDKSQWSAYDLEIRDFDEYSGPCEIDSDGESGDPPGNAFDHYNNNKTDQHLLTDQSKWTVTVRLYTKKAADQRSSDIPSVEETGSHYSSGEWHGHKSSSSQGSRESAKARVQQRRLANVANGMVLPREYSPGEEEARPPHTTQTLTRMQHKATKPRASAKLHYSYSERPLTKDELARHERLTSSSLNPTYAWSNGAGPDPQAVAEYEERLRQGDQPAPVGGENSVAATAAAGFNGLTMGGTHPQKYEHTGSLSQYLSLGTNHYKRSSLRGSNQRKKKDTEENWQGLCDSFTMPSRPQTTLPGHSERYFNGFENGVNIDSPLSTSPIDSLITDYLENTEILEDFSGSTHSLNTNTSGKGTSVCTSPKHSSPESVQYRQDMTQPQYRPNTMMTQHRPDTMMTQHRPDTMMTQHRPDTMMTQHSSRPDTMMTQHSSRPDTTMTQHSRPDTQYRDRKDSATTESRHPTASSQRPGAALRRHRSEPFHFLV